MSGKSIFCLAPSLLLAAIVILASLPFGSTHAWAVSAIEVAAFLLLGVLLAVRGIDGLRSSLGTLRVPLVILFAYLCAQRAGLPRAVLAWASPGTARLYQTLLGDTARWLPLSLDPHASGLAIVQLLAYVSVFLVVAAAPERKRSLAVFWLWTLLVAVFLTAAVAWLHVALGWSAKLFDTFAAEQGGGAPGRLSWPFVNPNHLATAMNLGWPIALGVLLSPAVFGAGATRVRRIGARIVALLLSLLFIVTLIGSRSRGGLIAAAAAPLVMSLAWPLETRAAARVRAGVGAAVLVALVAGAAWIAMDVAANPAEHVDLVALSRADATLLIRFVAIGQSLGMLRDFPVFGTGIGTWSELFPMYQRYPLLAVHFPFAHNDYVEWLEETGLVGFALLVALCAEYLLAVVRPLPPDAARRRAILFAAASTAAVHSAVDFGLRIPSNALLFTVVLGVLWRESLEAKPAAQPVRAVAQRFERLAATVAGVGAVALLVYLGTLEWRGDRHGDWQVLEDGAWRRLSEGMPDFDLAAAAVAAAPAAAPAHRTLAYASRSIFMRELEFRRAIRCAPAFETLRLDLARLLVALGRREEALKEVERAIYEDPYARPSDLMSLRDPHSGAHDFRDAVLRGLKRRGLESRPVADMARALEASAR
jgi:putative inorganic carbon (hco3(-)) transporter